MQPNAFLVIGLPGFTAVRDVDGKIKKRLWRARELNCCIFDLFCCFILTFEPIEYCSRSFSIVLEQIALNLLHKYFSSGRTCKSILNPETLQKTLSLSLSLSPPISMYIYFFFIFFSLCLLCLFCGCCRVLQPAAEFMCNTCYTYDMLDVRQIDCIFSLAAETSASAHNLLITLLRPAQWEKKTKENKRKEKVIETYENCKLTLEYPVRIA